MAFKAWLINKLNTGADEKLIYQGKAFMAFCELKMTSQIFKCFTFFSLTV